MPTSHPIYRLLMPLVVAFGALLPQVVTSAASEAYPGAAWDEPPPASTGWVAEKLFAADEIARSIGTDAYLVVHRGAVVHKFGQVDKPMNLATVRKSVFSVLYGIEVDQNHIDLNKTLAELGIDDKGGLSETEKQASVRHLLEARSGV